MTAEVEARQVLERSLNEKELLLQEVHHRVKNNLAILSSLLELQALTLQEAPLREIVRDTQSRILSVARAHEALYQTGEMRRGSTLAHTSAGWLPSCARPMRARARRSTTT